MPSSAHIDEQFDKIYEALSNAGRQGDRSWKERLFDMFLSQGGTFVMVAVTAALLFRTSRENGEHKEYKRVISARLLDVEHELQTHRSQVRRLAEARRQEVQHALDDAAARSATMKPEEVKKLVDRVLTGLIADVDGLQTTDAAPDEERPQPVTAGAASFDTSSSGSKGAFLLYPGVLVAILGELTRVDGWHIYRLSEDLVIDYLPMDHQDFTVFSRDVVPSESTHRFLPAPIPPTRDGRCAFLYCGIEFITQRRQSFHLLRRPSERRVGGGEEGATSRVRSTALERARPPIQLPAHCRRPSLGEYSTPQPCGLSSRHSPI